MDGELRVRVTGGEPFVVEAGERRELRVPVRGNGEQATIVQELAW